MSTCAQCHRQFAVSDDERQFLDRLAPRIGDQTVSLPTPTRCPTCRQQRRLVWRNERKLYRRICSKTGDEIVSMYAPDKPYPVYRNSVWWSDAWDSFQYGREIDLNRSVFEQIAELQKVVPRPAISQHKNVENSDYTNNVWYLKDCYLSFNISHAERCHYSDESYFITDLVDCFVTKHSEQGYELVDCERCSYSAYLLDCRNCNAAYLSYDCRNCSDVVLCSNLRNQQYCIRNVQYSKVEYERRKRELNLGSRANIRALRTEFAELIRQTIHAPDHNIKVEASTGDYLVECTDCLDCFFCYKGEHLQHVSKLDNDGKDCGDIDYAAEIERCYNTTVLNGYEVYFSAYIIASRSIFYSYNCHSSSNLFGCVGLRNAEYCIFNRQYSKEEYEVLVLKLIAAMRERGEWGEFFPFVMAPFGYNESAAQLLYPLKREEAINLGAPWQDHDFAPSYDAPAYEPKDDIAAYHKDGAEREVLLAGVLRDEVIRKPFKVIAPELAFYLSQGIPVPAQHPDSRYAARRTQSINPPKLFERQCSCAGACGSHQGNYGRIFSTTYNPDRPERVFCRPCYDSAIANQAQFLRQSKLI